MGVEKIVTFGDIRKEGGRMNYSKPLLLDNGKKIAVACGKEIRILNVSDSRNVSTLIMHKAKVVGMALDGEEYVISCDELGELFLWKLISEGVECVPLGRFPIPTGAVVEHIAHVGSNGELALAILVNMETGLRQLLLQRDKRKFMTKKYNVLITSMLSGSNKFSFSKTQSFCAVISSSKFGPACNIVPIHQYDGSDMKKKRKNRRILAGQRELTCVAVHPAQEILALGDHFGGIQIYYRIFDNKAPAANRRLHWHHLPVNDLVFSQSGAELYSCGMEGVLVQWNLLHVSTTEKSLLSRLGQPITHLAMSDDDATMVAVHSDNSFSLINLLDFKLVTVLVGQGVVSTNTNNTSKDSSRPPILVYDSRTKAVVTEAKPGYFHFYHTPSQQQLFLVDVVQENYTANADFYREVLCMSLSCDGCFMVTVDALGRSVDTQQVKFWSFSKSKQQWLLDTSVVYNHSGMVRGCLLQPHLAPSSQGDLPLCVTWGSDGNISVWGAQRTTDSTQWSTVHRQQLKGGQSASCVSWSPCGTLLAAAHGSTLSLWRPDPLVYLCSLSNVDYTEDLTALEFDPSCGGRVLLSSSRQRLVSWCLVRRLELYSQQLDVVALTADQHTGLMAVATEHGEVIVFRGSEGEPLCNLDLGDTGLRTMIFCPPQNRARQHCFTRLLYYTQDLELMTAPVLVSCSGDQMISPDGLDSDERREAASHGHQDDEDEMRSQSNLTLLMAETRAIEAPSDDLFAFRKQDRASHVPADFFTKRFEDELNHNRPSLSSMLLKLGRTLDEAAVAGV